MKSVGDIMKEMGFNKDAPVETQKAFIKHLIKQATGANVQNIPEKTKPSEKSEQLEFDLELQKPSA